jgi:hypothetical protein
MLDDTDHRHHGGNPDMTMNMSIRSRRIACLALALSVSIACSGVRAGAPTPGKGDQAGRHALSAEFGAAAADAGRDFAGGARRVATPFVVVGKTAIDGVAFVVLAGATGTVYAAEEAILGAKYVAKGAKFVLIKTAQGAFWVAVAAIVAGQIVLDAVEGITELVIEGVVYVLITLEQGVAFVAKTALATGRVVLGGMTYIMKETAEGIVWVSEQTWKAIKAGASWTRNSVLVANVRTRLSKALLSGDVGDGTMSYFRDMAANPHAGPDLRRLASASHAACAAFNATYRARP